MNNGARDAEENQYASLPHLSHPVFHFHIFSVKCVRGALFCARGGKSQLTPHSGLFLNTNQSSFFWMVVGPMRLRGFRLER